MLGIELAVAQYVAANPHLFTTHPTMASRKQKEMAREASLSGITYGSDPEFMLYDLDQRRIVSAIPVLKNDKHHPIELGDGILMYADNVLVEFSFPPALSHGAFLATLQRTMRLGQAKLGPKYRLVAKAAHIYPEDQLKDQAALEGGCSPNFDVYAGAPNPPTKFDGGLRTGSFHIHVGHPELDSRESKDRMIRILDHLLGVASVIMDTDPTALQRRKLYGKAGEFRPTPYGIEYRVLGPYCIQSPGMVHLCLTLVDKALLWVMGSRGKEVVTGFATDKVRNVIDTNDRNAAFDLLGGVVMSGLYAELCATRTPDLYRDWDLMGSTVINWEGYYEGEPYRNDQPVKRYVYASQTPPWSSHSWQSLTTPMQPVPTLSQAQLQAAAHAMASTNEPTEIDHDEE